MVKFEDGEEEEAAAAAIALLPSLVMGEAKLLFKTADILS